MAPPKKATRQPKLVDETFVYTAPAGGTISIPPMGKALNAAELRRLKGQDHLQVLFYVLERDNADMDEVDAVLETMSIDEDVPDMLRQWQEHSKITLGESTAS